MWNMLRLSLIDFASTFVDESFLDVWFSRRTPCKYAFHRERRHIDGTVYRWDNATHGKLRRLNTFPHYFHEGAQHNIRPFKPRDTMENTLKTILNYIKQRIKTANSRLYSTLGLIKILRFYW